MRAIIALSFLFIAACGGDLGRDKHLSPPAMVVEVGSCIGRPSLSECAIKVKYDNGLSEFGLTRKPVMVGQIVYKECWMESDGAHCFLYFTDSPRDSFKKGKAK